MDIVTQLKNAIEFAKKNPNDPKSVQLRQRIQSGMYSNELKQIQFNPATTPKLFGTTGVGKVANTVTSSEQGFGASIGDALYSGKATDVVVKAQKEHADAIQSLSELRKRQKAAGKDTTHTDNLLKQMLSETRSGNVPGSNIGEIIPSINKSTGQILGEAGGVALDIASAGSYGNAAKRTTTGQLFIKTAAEKTADKVAAETAKDVFKAAPLSEKLATIGKKTVVKSVIGAGTGYGYDVSQNLQSGKTGKEAFKPGMGTLLGGTIPLAVGGIQASVAITKSTAPKFINSLIKPKQADFSYGKDPGRTVSEMGITGNNMDDFAQNIGNKKNEVGTQLGAIYSNPANASITINASDEIAKLDTAIEKASKGGKQNQGIVTALQDTKDALLYEHKNVDGVITRVGDTPRDLSKLSPQEAFDLKKVIAEQTKFTGKPSDDKTVNSILKNMYGGLKTKLNTALSKNNPKIIKLNQQYADLTSAEIATLNRDAIVKRADMISMPIKVGGATALITALSTGGAAIPALLAGASAAALDKALASTAVKTRIAAWLGSASPSMISKLPQGVKNSLYRALPKFASQLGQK